MSKVAEEVFFSDAFKRNEKERYHWNREVLDELLSLRLDHGITALGNQSIEDVSKYLELACKLSEHVIESGNDIVSNVIIQAFLNTEENERIRELVTNVWIGLWDAPDSLNACINSQAYYDGSFLIRFTSDLQIMIRKVVELFTTEIFAQRFLYLLGEIPQFLTRMLSIELHDIKYEDSEIGVKNLLDVFPENMREGYNSIFEYAFLSGCAFVIFHEIGHQIEADDELAAYYGATSSRNESNTKEMALISEYNADLISMKIITKLFGKDEAIDWLGYAGILLSFLALSIQEDDPTQETTHPSIQNRYFRAKQFIIESYASDYQTEIFVRTDAVAQLLTAVTNWVNKDWWK